MYWVYLDRRTQLEDRQATLETQTFNLFPERWAQLYRDEALAAMGGEGEDAELPVTDIESLDAWYEQMVAGGGRQFMTGEGHPVAGEEWGDWS